MARILLRSQPERHGERATLEKLSQLPDPWTVFYSLGFLDRKGFDRQRELDFLALHPQRGAVFIEVKGGQVRFDDGVVRQHLDTGWKTIDPIGQLNGARRVAIEVIRSVQSEFVPARNLYVFPSTVRPHAGLNQELSVASVFSDEMGTLVKVIEEITSDTTADLDLERLTATLRPCLTHDVNIAEPFSPATASPFPLPTLSAISSGTFTDFSSLTDVKRVLIGHRAALQDIWDQVASAQTELEQLSGQSLEGGDLLSTLLRETENLLSSDKIEVAIFGQVKRGKSTLVNSLVGREVSAVGMLPKTAVPVVIEWSAEESGWVQYADGSTSIVPLEQAIASTTQAERRSRLEKGLPLVDRVTVRLPLDWLPAGVRLVDTPGLSDPSMVKDYEHFARAELERVAAGVLVISYPPGPEIHETELLQSLASFGLSKLFFVINMWSDVWADKTARQEISAYVTELVATAAANGADIAPDDVRVFTANLGAARSAQNSGGRDDLEGTGLPEIQAVLEEFLTTGALGRVSTAAARRLTQASQVIRDTLLGRRAAIEFPERVAHMRSELENSVERSSTIVDEIMERVTLRCERLSLELEAIASEPYAAARTQLSASRDRELLRNLQTGLAIKSSTTASHLATVMTKTATVIVADARTSLARDLNLTGWNFTAEIDSESLFLADFSEPIVKAESAPSDYSTEARGIGALLGAVLGGGSGIALAATGPIGLLVGGLLGFMFGDAVGALTSSRGNGAEASDEELSRLRTAIDTAETRSRAAVVASVRDLGASIKRSLDDQRRELLAGARRELATIERILSDSSRKGAALDQIAGALSRLEEIRG